MGATDHLPDFGSGWLVDKQKASTSQSVVYKRGANSVTIQARTEQAESVLEQEGVIVNVVSRDFIFLAADLILNSVLEEPKRGDRITWGGSEYDVFPVDGEKVWRWSDNFKKQIRVQTQEVKS